MVGIIFESPSSKQPRLLKGVSRYAELTFSPTLASLHTRRRPGNLLQRICSRSTTTLRKRALQNITASLAEEQARPSPLLDRRAEPSS